MVNPSQKIPKDTWFAVGKLKEIRFHLAKSIWVALSPVLDGLTAPETLTGPFSLNYRQIVVSTMQM